MSQFEWTIVLMIIVVPGTIAIGAAGLLLWDWWKEKSNDRLR